MLLSWFNPRMKIHSSFFSFENSLHPSRIEDFRVEDLSVRKFFWDSRKSTRNVFAWNGSRFNADWENCWLKCWSFLAQRYLNVLLEKSVASKAIKMLESRAFILQEFHNFPRKNFSSKNAIKTFFSFEPVLTFSTWQPTTTFNN